MLFFLTNVTRKSSWTMKGSEMGLFDKVLNALGLAKPKEDAAPVSKPVASPAIQKSVENLAMEHAKRLEQIRKARESKEIPMVDVMAKLEKLAAEQPMKSNWKTSIADLLFLLGIDHSYEARKEMAVELGCPAEYMADSAKMNTWLHKEVLQRIAANGGNIPMELLD
jgi:hypothetical protein